MNHIHLLKDILLPKRAHQDKQCTKGDRVDWVATRKKETNKQTNMEALAGLGENAVNVPDESPAFGKTNNTSTYHKIISRETKTVL